VLILALAGAARQKGDLGAAAAASCHTFCSRGDRMQHSRCAQRHHERQGDSLLVPRRSANRVIELGMRTIPLRPDPLRVFFSLQYPSKGLGMTKLYWDATDGDKAHPPSDQFLAYSIAFVVE